MDLYRLPRIFSFKTNKKGIEQVKEIEKNESVGGNKKGEFKKRFIRHPGQILKLIITRCLKYESNV